MDYDVPQSQAGKEDVKEAEYIAILNSELELLEKIEEKQHLLEQQK